MEEPTLHNPPLSVHRPLFSTRLLALITHDVAGTFGMFRFRLFFRRRFVSLCTFCRAEALRRCLTSSRRSLCRCQGFGGVGRLWRGRIGLDGVDGLAKGEDMQVRERLNVQETVTNNTWGGKFNEVAACLRNMSLRADVLHSFTCKQCQSALKVCLAC